MKWFNDVMERIDVVSGRPEFHDFRLGFAWDMAVSLIAIMFGVFVAMLAGLDNETGPSIAGMVLFGITFGIGFLLTLRAVLRAKHDSE